jgi:hypothetical protein
MEVKSKMADLDDIIQGQLKGDKAQSARQDKDEVDKTTQHMKAIKEVKDVADEISGAGDLRKQVEESDKAREKSERELAEERNRQLQDQIKNLQTEMTKQFDQKGPNPEVAKLMQQLENTKTELIQSRFDYLTNEIKELRNMKNSGANQGAIDQQIKAIKAAANELGLQAPSVTTTSPELQIQLKQMDINLQLQMEQMKDDRDRRDKEWELTLKKWDEEKELRQGELAVKVAAEKDKMALASDFMKKIGGTFARATIDAGQEMTAGKVASQVIQANEGDYGEIACQKPGCDGTIAIARDAVKAICPNCSTVYDIQRIARKPEIEPET